MPYRNIVFGTGEYYHVFNRSVGSDEIFIQKNDLNRFLRLINFYRFPRVLSFSDLNKLTTEVRQARMQQIYSSLPLVEIHCFSLMPNHYHLLIRQLCENGITTFISNLQNSYAKYFNTRHDRHGTLFSNMFKAIRVESDEQLYHLSRYIHINPVTGYLIKIDALCTYPYTSFTTYMNNVNYQFISTGLIRNHFKTIIKYKQFVYDQADYQRKLKKLHNVLLD